MPVYNLTSQKTGNTYPVNFDSQPTESDVDEAIAHFDTSVPSAPQLRPAQQRALEAQAAMARNAALPLLQEGDYSGAIPLHGYKEAAAEGYKTGQEAFGEGVLGKSIGALFGAAMAAGTALNPLAKGTQAYAQLAQAGGEALGGQEGQALQSLTGERAVLPDLQPSAYNTGNSRLNTALNFVSELATQARKDPVSAAMILEGLRSPQATRTVQNLPGSVAEAVTGPIKATKGAVSRLATTPDDLLSFTTGSEKAPQLFKDSLEAGSFNEILPDLARAKTSGGVDGVNAARKTLNNETFEVIKPVVKALDPESPLFNKETILEQADLKLADEIDTPEVRQPALAAGSKYLTNLTPDNLLARYGDISDQLISYWKSQDQGRFANKTKALEAIRSVLSDTIKSSLDERGVDPTIWSKYGKTNELVDRMVKNYGTENQAYKSKRGEGILSKKGVQGGDIISRVPFAGPAIRGASNLIERAKGGTPRLLNKRVDQLFEGIEPSGPILSQPNLNQLLQQVSEEAQANRQLALQRQASLGLTE